MARRSLKRGLAIGLSMAFLASVASPAGAISPRLTRSTADEIMTRLEAIREAIPSQYAYGAHADLASGTVVIETDAPASSFTSVSNDYVGLVTVKYANLSRLGRHNDVLPFWGADSIVSGTHGCTSGFAVLKGSSKYMLSASHCYALGAIVKTDGTNLTIGPVAYRSDYPNTDGELIGPNNLQGFFWADPTTSRYAVKGTATPVLNSSNYCTSGSYSLNMCGWSDFDNNTLYCDSAGCTSHVYYFKRDDGNHVQGGDSGGPVYTPVSGGAKVVGIIFAGDFVGCGTCSLWVEPYSRLATLYSLSGVVTQ